MNGYAISPLVLAHYKARRDPDGLVFEVEKVIARADEHDDAGERRAWEGFAQAVLIATRGNRTHDEVGALADEMLSEWRARYARRVPR